MTICEEFTVPGDNQKHTLKYEHDKGDSIMRVYLDGDKGVLSYKTFIDRASGEHVADILRVDIHLPENRGKGLGTGMLQCVMNHLKAKNITMCTLLAMTHCPSKTEMVHKFYMKSGFRYHNILAKRWIPSWMANAYQKYYRIIPSGHMIAFL